MSARATKLLVIAFVLLLAIFVGVRTAAWHLVQHQLHARPQSNKTPQQYGAPYQELTFSSDGHALKAFYVAPPPSPRPVSLLIFHGDNESIASWAPVQGLLYAHGVGSMVFDYSGFGHSEGKPTLDHARDDGLAAWTEFKSMLPAGTRACAYGLSLGTGVLLEDAARFSPPPDCLVVYGAFTSALGAGVRLHRVPPWAKPFLKDALVSEENAAHLPAKLLVIHGERDEKFPVADAQTIASVARARLIVLPGFTHAQPVVKPDEAGWKDAIAFVNGE